ncbi:MAG TPA: ribosome silencing factor [Gammaproteobacteria bacterium]|nr:ribosome silencing factor [Gammaproteobacteria bacterium]
MTQSIQDRLEEFQADKIIMINVEKLTTVTSNIIICSANSTTHAHALLREVKDLCKTGSIKYTVEGDDTFEWIIVDLGYIMVHIMLPELRDFYHLESLWDIHIDE